MGLPNSIHMTATPYTLLQKICQYEISDVKRAYSLLKSRHSNLGKYVDCTTLIQILPFGIATSYILVAQFEDGNHHKVDWRPCLGGLAVCVRGSSQSKLHLLFQMHQLLGCPVAKETLRAAFSEVLFGAERLYRTGVKLYEGTQRDVFFNVDGTVYDLLDEVYLDDKSHLLSLEDIQDWAEHHPSLIQDMLHFDHDKNSPVSSKQCSPTSSVSKLTNESAAYKWNPVLQGRSQPRPTSRSQHAACVYEGKVYVHGGRHGNMAHKDMWRFDIATSQWQKLDTSGDKPILLQQHTMVAYKGRLFVFGGEFTYGATEETPLWILHLDSLHWEKYQLDCEVMVPYGRRGHTTVVCHHAMHIYGGYQDLKGSNSELWTFDFEEQMWHLAYSHVLTDNGPGPRHNHSAVVHDNAMWVYGGMTNLQQRGDLWRWNFSVRNWTKVKFKAGPPELSGHSACKVHDSMLLFGGSCQGDLNNDMWKFHFASQNWQKVNCDSIRPSPRMRHCMVGIQPLFCSSNEDSMCDRSQSVPQLRHDHGLPLTDELGPRPSSSPAIRPGKTDEGGKAGMDHVFHNRIIPTGNQHKLTGPLRQRSTFPATGGSKHFSCVPAVVIGHTSSSSGSSGNAQSAACAARQLSISRDLLSTADLGSGSDEEPLLLGKVSRSKTMDDGLDQKFQAGFDNPTFLGDNQSKSIHISNSSSSILEESEYSPVKKYKRDDQFSDDFVLEGQTRTKSVSVDSLVSRCSIYSLGSVGKGEFPKGAKSGSLESLLNEIGGVNLTYANVVPTNEMPDILKDTPCSRRDNDLVLEDIEDKDLIDLNTAISGSPLHNTCKPSLGLELEDLENQEMQVFQGNLPLGKLIHVPKVVCDNPQDLSVHKSDLHSLAVQKFAVSANITTQGTACELVSMSDSTFRDVPPGQSSNYEEENKYSAKIIQNFEHAQETAFMPAVMQKSPKAETEQSIGNARHKNSASPSCVPKRSPMPEKYCFFLFGGREAEAQNLHIKPLSVWKLEVTYGSSVAH